AGGRNAVCAQGEWDAMERANPGHHTLVKGGIATEGEAERLARSTPMREAAAPAAAAQVALDLVAQPVAGNVACAGAGGAAAERHETGSPGRAPLRSLRDEVDGP